jgi:outer membrane protein assembly factor BamB
MTGRVQRLARTRRRQRRSFGALLIALGILIAAASAWRSGLFEGSTASAPRTPGTAEGTTPQTGAPTSPQPPRQDPGARPINTSFEGLTTFRGNATRTYYGEGPVPRDPEILWRFPESGGMCSESSDEQGVRTWCGTGWTGQPNVVETEDGDVEVRFGAYDRAVHILDGRTGKPLYEAFTTGDLIKGTVTSDPDGYPLLYTGSRDNYLRILALDRGDRPQELWALNADSAPSPVWNNDWDGSPLVIDDHLIEGGENSWFYVIDLNRDYDRKGKVTVDPEIRLLEPGYDDQLFADLGDQEVSIESSVAFDPEREVAYFANSGGLVQGWDLSRVLDGGKKGHRVFRFWTGEDTDASVVIDEEGSLYVASELERFNARSEEVGQLMKLDPSNRRDPVVWSLDLREPGPDGAGGLWATPGLWGDAVIAATNSGEILAVDRRTGKVGWELSLPPATWTSPVIVDDVLIVGDCAGVLHAYDLGADPLRGPPSERWSVELEGCIESTPAVWKGMVYVGSRGGAIYGIGDR